MGVLGDLKEWLTWWGEEQRKRREEVRAQHQERRAESRDLREVLDEQIRDVEVLANEGPTEEARNSVQRQLRELRHRKVILLETEIRSHPQYDALVSKLSEPREAGLLLSGFQLPEVAPPSGQPERTPEAIAAERLDDIAFGFARAGRHELAELLLSEALEVDPGSPLRWFNRGLSRHHLNRHGEALQDYDRSLELRPGDPDTLNNRAVTLYRLARYEDAVVDLSQSLRIRPKDPDTLYNRGTALCILSCYERALRDFNRSLQLRPDDPLILNNRGAAFEGLGQDQKALADYNRALEITPDKSHTLNNRAVLLARRGQHEEALRDIDRAMPADPGNPWFRTTRAEILHRQGDAMGAEAAFERALADATDKADAHYAIAETRCVLGALAAAYSNLCQAVAEKEGLRGRARHEPDFENLRNDPEYGLRFRELVGEN